MRWLAAVAVLVAGPALAQSRVGSVRANPFVPGEARIDDSKGDLVGTARDNAFIPGEVDLYDKSGRSTGIEARENPFDPERSDILDRSK